MPFTHWLTLRQAKEALRNGRPDDAHRLLDQLLADGHRKAWRLTRDVALAYITRGERLLRADTPELAWKELLAAEALNTGEGKVADLRQALTRIGLAECRAALEAGKPIHVVEAAARLRSRNTRHPELVALEEAAQDWVLAGEMADRGDFLLAVATAEKVRPRLAGPTTGLDRFVRELGLRHETFRAAVSRVTDAAEAGDWQAAARAADEVIAVAPAHREARQAQLRAWDAVANEGMAVPLQAVPALATPERTMTYVPAAYGGASAFAATKTAPPPTPVAASSAGPPSPASSAGGLPKRFLLWVDGVGGYLVCLGGRVTFGQATADGPIDVPLFADLSRLHAEVSRDGEGYLLESTRGVQVNGAAASRSVLRCGDRVTLGATCQFLFRQPVPVSPSARLELVSGHRLPLAVDGVLLMADNLVLGPGSQVHVTVPWATGDVILYRSKDGLGVRYAGGEFRVDNKPFRDRAGLPLPGVVSAEAFAFAVEPVGARL